MARPIISLRGGAGVETLLLLGPEGLRAIDALHAREPAQQSQAFPHGGYSNA